MAGATQKFSPTGHPRRNLSFPRGARIPPKSMAQELQSTTKTGTGGGGIDFAAIQETQRKESRCCFNLSEGRRGEHGVGGSECDRGGREEMEMEIWKKKTKWIKRGDRLAGEDEEREN